MVKVTTKKECRAFPKGQQMTEQVKAWCARNRHLAMCLECRWFPVDGPDVSIYQKEKTSETENVPVREGS
jgi:hypothetical protein